MKNLKRGGFLKALVILFLLAFFSICIALTVGAFELTDTFFYYNTGQHILYGYWHAAAPYNYTVPYMLYGPVYSVLVAVFLLTLPLPYSWGITAFQIFCMGISLYVYRSVLRYVVPKSIANATVILTILMPYTLAYTSVIMAESFTMSLVLLYVSLVIALLKQKTNIPPSALVLFSVVLTLTKFVFQFLIPFSIMLWIYIMFFGKKRKKTASRLLVHTVFVALAALCLYGWIHYVYSYHGKLSLTTHTGRHLFYGVVSSMQIYPPENSEIFRYFMTILPSKEYLKGSFWDIHPLWAWQYGQGLIDEMGIDEKFYEFAKLAIQTHPLEYARQVLKYMVIQPISKPYDKMLLTHLGLPEPGCAECKPVPCRIHWSRLCQPPLSVPWINRFWGYLVHYQRVVYFPYGAVVLYAMFFIGMIYTWIRKNWLLLLIAGIVLGYIFIHAGVAGSDGRYMIPIYGPYALIVIYGFTHFFHTVKTRIGITSFC